MTRRSDDNDVMRPLLRSRLACELIFVLTGLDWLVTVLVLIVILFVRAMSVW